MSWISRMPLRKPLAIYAAALVGIVVLWCMAKGCDMPPNIKDLLQWFGGITLAAYFATSTTEAVKGCSQKEPS